MEKKCMFPTIHAPAALGHLAPAYWRLWCSAPTYWRVRRSSTRRLRHFHTGACGARPLGAFGAYIVHTRACGARPLGDWAPPYSRLRRSDTRLLHTGACGGRPLGAFAASILATAALGHSAPSVPPYWRVRHASTRRLRHLHTGACGARPCSVVVCGLQNPMRRSMQLPVLPLKAQLG